MQKCRFKVSIIAPREKVWDTLWNEDTYREWTSAFAEGSCAVTDWKKGSKVLFLDGKGSGMVARIEENRPNEFMSIVHLGEVKDGVEDTTSARVKQWAGAHEDYTLSEIEGVTEVIIDMDIADEYVDMFQKLWPKALAKLKEVAEK